MHLVGRFRCVKGKWFDMDGKPADFGRKDAVFECFAADEPDVYDVFRKRTLDAPVSKETALN